MHTLEECYKTLEVGPDTSYEDIHRAYRDMLMVWHPDRFPSNSRLQIKAQEKTARINEAFREIESALHTGHAGSAHFSHAESRHETAEERSAYADTTYGSAEQHAKPRRKSRSGSWRHPSWLRAAKRYTAVAASLLVVAAVTMGIVGHVRQENIPIIRTTSRAHTEDAQLTQARKVYEKAVQIKPRDAKAHYKLGEVYAKMGLNEEALATFRNAVKFEPNYAEAYYQLGLVYANMGRHDQAVEVYKQAIRSRPDFTSAYFKLSEAYRNLGRQEDAAEAYNQAIQRTAHDAETHDIETHSSETHGVEA